MQRLIDATMDPNGHDSRQFSALVFGLALTMRAKTIVDLGVRDGGFSAPLLAAAEITGGIVHGVDIVTPSFAPTSKAWRFTKGDARDFLGFFKGTIDIVSIDDFHGEDHVFEELAVAWGRLSRNGIIMMHDTMHSGSHPLYNLTEHRDGVFLGRGPAGALGRFLAVNLDVEYFTFPVSHGLTVIRHAENRPL